MDWLYVWSTTIKAPQKNHQIKDSSIFRFHTWEPNNIFIDHLSRRRRCSCIMLSKVSTASYCLENSSTTPLSIFGWPARIPLGLWQWMHLVKEDPPISVAKHCISCTGTKNWMITIVTVLKRYWGKEWSLHQYEMKENNKTYCRKCIRSQSTQIRGTSYSRREGDEGFGSCSRSTDLSQTDWSSFYKRAPPRTTRHSAVALRVVRLDILCDSLPSWFLIPLEADVDRIPDRFHINRTWPTKFWKDSEAQARLACG